jgi:flagellar motility protein MotE (MotC chaperone)
MAVPSTQAASVPRQAAPLATKAAPAPARGAPAPMRAAPAPGARISTGQAAAPTQVAIGRRRVKLGRSFALPLAAAGLAVLLPWRAVDVLHQWQALSTPAEAAQTLPALPAQNTSGPLAVQSGGATAAQTSPPPAQPAAFDEQHAPDGRLLTEIAQRAAALDQRDNELQTRAAQVAAAERLARQEIAELTRLRQDIEKLVAHESEASEADINLLVGLYSNMKPAQAAAVLGRLEAPQAAEILQRLAVHSAGPVLAAMDPAAALAITEVLANRRVPFRR